MDTPDGTVARRVGVLGAAGRMGRTTCDAVAAAPDLDLVAVADPTAVGDEVAGCTVLDGVEAVVAAGVDVVVDFTVADAARANLLRALAENENVRRYPAFFNSRST